MNSRRLVGLLLSGVLLAGAVHAADERRFDSGGVEIRYFIEGEGEPLVLVHGFTGSATTAWLNPGVFDAMVDAGFQAIAIDNRGHGGSEKPHRCHDDDAEGEHHPEDPEPVVLRRAADPERVSDARHEE